MEKNGEEIYQKQVAYYRSKLILLKNNNMKQKLLVTLLISLLFSSVTISQTTYYIPGSGTTVKELNFETKAQLTEKFNYGSGWAGAGFVWGAKIVAISALEYAIEALIGTSKSMARAASRMRAIKRVYAE